MNENLKIGILEMTIREAIEHSGLSVGTVHLLLKKITSEVENLYNEDFLKNLEEYNKSLKENKEKEKEKK